MKRTLRKIVSLFAVFAVALLCLPEFASPVGSAKAADQKAVVYVDEDRTEQTVSSYTLLSGKSTVKEWKEGCYVVGEGVVSIASRVSVSGDVVLVIPKGSVLTVPKGIYVPKDASLSIYGEGLLSATNMDFSKNPTVQVNNGKLYVGGNVVTCFEGVSSSHRIKNTSVTNGQAAIGGNGGKDKICGKIMIVDAIVLAAATTNGAGIGGGNGESGDITIYGGIVIARGGTNGAGIGTGPKAGGAIGDKPNAGDGTITITGGYVEALGGTKGAGIGGGQTSAGGTILISERKIVLGDGTYVTTQGTVVSVGGGEAAGIGSGSFAKKESPAGKQSITITEGNVTAEGNGPGSGIGSGLDSNNTGKTTFQNHCGTITISGGVVNAKAGSSSFATAIGGYFLDENDSVTISGGDVTAIGVSNAQTSIGCASNAKTGARIVITGGMVTARTTANNHANSIGIGDGSHYGTSEEEVRAPGQISISFKDNSGVTSFAYKGEVSLENGAQVSGATEFNETTVFGKGKYTGENLEKFADKTLVQRTKGHVTFRYKLADYTDGESEGYYDYGAMLSDILPDDFSDAPFTQEYTYKLEGWKIGGQTIELDEQAVDGDITVEAFYDEGTKNKYEVTFKYKDADYEDDSFSDKVEYGTTLSEIVPANVPENPATKENTYTFLYWSIDGQEVNLEKVTVADDVTVTAVYSDGTKNYYKITWTDEEGNTIGTTTVEYGTVPTHAALEKEATPEYEFTFEGWTPEVKAVDGAATYKAVFKPVKRSYTITWKDDAGKTIDTTTVEYGIKPTHADAVKENTDKFEYTFEKWTPAITEVTGDATYTAVFLETEIKREEPEKDKGVYQLVGNLLPYKQFSGEKYKLQFKRTKNDEITFLMFDGIADETRALAAGEDYTASQGSVIIELSPAYLDNLEVGKHKITVSFKDGDPVTIETEILPKDEEETETTEPTENTKPEEKVESPKTGDERADFPYMLLILAALCACGVVAVSGRCSDSGTSAGR
jgi:hypothetical protein